MDMTVTGIGSVVVAELRAAGYLESTIGQYGRTIVSIRNSCDGVLASARAVGCDTLARGA